MVTSFTNRWTDVYYDLELIVLNAQNKSLGSARITGKTEALGKGANVKKQKLIPPSEMITRMNQLLAQKNIANAFAKQVPENDKSSDIQSDEERTIPLGQISGSKVQNMSEVKLKSDSIAGDLRQYKKLLDEGVITQDDYNAKKKKLLGL